MSYDLVGVTSIPLPDIKVSADPNPKLHAIFEKSPHYPLSKPISKKTGTKQNLLAKELMNKDKYKTSFPIETDDALIPASFNSLNKQYFRN